MLLREKIYFFGKSCFTMLCHRSAKIVDAKDHYVRPLHALLYVVEVDIGTVMSELSLSVYFSTISTLAYGRLCNI